MKLDLKRKKQEKIRGWVKTSKDIHCRGDKFYKIKPGKSLKKQINKETVIKIIFKRRDQMLELLHYIKCPVFYKNYENCKKEKGDPC